MSSVFDAGDAEQVGPRNKNLKILAEQRINGLKKLAADPDCRAWLWQFLEQSAPLATPFDIHSDSKTAFNCGTKIFTAQILDQMLTHCPAEYYLMKHEAKEKDGRPGKDLPERD